MSFNILGCSITRHLIEQYCAGKISDTRLKKHIKLLGANDLLLKNENGLNFLLSTVEFNSPYSKERFARVIEWLFTQARELQSPPWSPVASLFYAQIISLRPWQMFLNLDFGLERNGLNVDVVSVFSDNVYCLINEERHNSMTLDEAITLLDLNVHTLYSAFLCRDIQNTRAYLRCVYEAITKVPELREYYLSLFFVQNDHGYRLFDQLLQIAPVENMHFFLEELKNLRKIGLSENEHLDLLINHPRAAQGFSPLHELILNNNFKKIKLYFDELKNQFSSNVLANELLKKNSHGYMAIQQGVNNGIETPCASIEIAELFLETLKSDMFSLTTRDLILFGDMHQKRLKCSPCKENASEINKRIGIIREQLLKQPVGGYESVRLFGTSPQKQVVDPRVVTPLEADLIRRYY